MGQRGSSLNDDSDSQPSSSPAIQTDPESEIRTRQESEPPIINPLNVGEREKYYYFGRNNSLRKKFHYCGDCPYRAYHWKPLKSHIKKLHPSSSTALLISTSKALKKLKGKSGQHKNFTNKKVLNGRHNSIPKLDRTNLHHRMRRHKQVHHKKFVHYSAIRKRDAYYSHTNDSTHPKNSTNNQNEGWSWYYPRNGGRGPRFRVYCCLDCGYKAVHSDLVKHVMSTHPSFTSALPPKVPLGKIHQCAECGYQTKSKKHLNRHRVYHNEKSAHQCPWCSFSVNGKKQLGRHVRQYHTKIIDKNDLIASENEYRFHCAHCPYKNNYKCNLERHVVHHRDPPAEHQCHLCSFSVNNRGSLTVHLKLHYQEMDENNNNNFDDQLNIENGRGNKRVAGSSLNSRRSLLSCRDCRLFKTTSRFTLKRHAKRAHPFSLSALPPVSNKRPKTNHHLKKRNLKVTQETHQAVEDALVSAPEGTREDWYVAPNGKTKRRYIYCGDCNYRTTSRYNMMTHAEKRHPLSTTAIPSQPLGTQLFNCLECDFSTSNAGNMKGHMMSHQRNGKFKCSYCSFSSDFRSTISLHFKYGHHHNIKSARIEEVRSEAKLRKQFDIKECCVVLRNIFTSSLIQVLNLENEEEDNQVDEIQLLKTRLKAMEERARIAAEEVKEISSKKMNVQKRIDEIERRRALIEYLRSQQCNLLEMSLSARNEEEDDLFMKPVGEKVNCLETEMKVIDGKLGALKEEEKSLAQDLECAQESHSGVVQVIEALQSELDGYC